MPMVETSVAVATPSITAVRIRNGSTSAGTATTKALPMIGQGGRVTPARFSPRPRQRATSARAMASTSAGISPPVNSAAIDTPVTEPMVISTSDGGIVSLMAPEADSSDTSSPGWKPRRFISGNSTGVTAAMSAAFEPEMPETRYIAPSSTYDSPPALAADTPAAGG